MPRLTFDARWNDGNGQGVQVDADLLVRLYEAADTAPVLKATRVLGTHPESAIDKLQDANGYYYRTVVEVEDYLPYGKVRATWVANVGGTPQNLFTEDLPYPVVGPFNARFVLDSVFAHLGHPVVHVELQERQFYLAVLRPALQNFNAWTGGRLNGKSLTLVPGKSEYIVEGLAARDVADVAVIRAVGFSLNTDPVFGREFPRYPQMQTADYALTLGYIQDVQRLTGTDPDWEYDRATRRLRITLGGQEITSVHAQQYLVYVRYWETLGLQDIPETLQEDFVTLCLGYAKRVLSQIRGKFGGVVPSPGGNARLNSDVLREEGAADVKTAEDALRAYGHSQVFPTYG